MMAHNLCYSRMSWMKRSMEHVRVSHTKRSKLVIENYKFAQDVPSLLPSILLELKQFRKNAKKDMARATGSMKEVYNGKQLAYKVSMNSVYGFTGAGKGILTMCSDCFYYDV